MKATWLWIVTGFLLSCLWSSSPLAAPRPEAEPIKLLPENPHYLLFRGRPVVLVTAGEHYGAALNLDFDVVTYLQELHARGFNQTRVFSGFYRELPGTFGIPENTLAPRPNRFVCPWARSATPGAADGGNKFDLNQWDPTYFNRLKVLVTEASRQGVVVELVLFCTMYDDSLWSVCPLNARNNLQGIGTVTRSEIFSFKEPALIARQDAMVRKIVTELGKFDNVYYEICNEPYERPGFTREWNDHVASVITEAESASAVRHLIAQGMAHRSAKVNSPNPRVAIFNFHSATPESASLNYHFNKAIADDETGGQGSTDFSLRSEAWEFLLAGGGIFSHLDFSFTCKHPDGTASITGALSQRHRGGAALRRQLQVLKEFLESFDLPRMRPDRNVISQHRVVATDANVLKPAKAAALSRPGTSYAIYTRGGMQSELVLKIPAGTYRAEWINTEKGNVERTERFDHTGGEKTLVSPRYAEDIALRLRRSAP